MKEGINPVGPEIGRKEAIEDGNIWNDLYIKVINHTQTRKKS